MHAVDTKLSDEERTILEVTGQAPIKRTKPSETLYGGKMHIIEFVALAILGLVLPTYAAAYLTSIMMASLVQLISYILLASFVFSLFMVRKATSVSVFTYIFAFTAPGFIDFFVNLFVQNFLYDLLFGLFGVFAAYFILERNGIF